ncbi:MAG: 3-phosphoglycerate dehydrogenase [Synergistaceae bacterium]|jgi:D-3-phosphoglycerate dehydrogenase|nr:3-phosphoglycerate dehydrogenase [Synergistaceae bacterium]
MFNVLCLNKIAREGIAELPPRSFSFSEGMPPNGILVRSAPLLDMPLNPELLAIARAGAGVNNIPVARCSEAGIAVFNTPGANANAVKELTIAGLLLSSRRIVEGINWIRGASLSAEEVESGKERFAGPELAGKKIGVVGLGAVGVLVANACDALGMNVTGYDPYVTVEAAWSLSRGVKRARGEGDVMAGSDYVTLHVPLNDSTKGFVGERVLSLMKKGARLLNFSRGGVVDDAAVIAALKSGRLSRYVTDFPSTAFAGVDGVLAMPHLGASTPEAEVNCAVAAARRLRDYMENGCVKNSVNLPDCDMGAVNGMTRITVFNRNVPNVVGPITSALAAAGANIAHMLNRSKGEYAYNIIDVDGPLPLATLREIEGLAGVIRARLLNNPTGGDAK